ncbi:hypothetical protein [Microbulbifer taiwanensis]|uniref:hypothetical protein n=1 Tax=Microbulbifer taiwanensis TaxID=986746 RepID=UPI00360C1C3A
MLEQADLFLSGRPPYSGRYLRDIAALGAPMDQLSHLDMEFRADPPASLGAFKQRTEAALDMGAGRALPNTGRARPMPGSASAAGKTSLPSRCNRASTGSSLTSCCAHWPWPG